jgi:nucleotide-binding universal stress UspA family protein
MRIVVGYLRTPEGRAALQRAIEEAKLRDAELVVVHTARDDADEVRSYDEEFKALTERLEGEGVRVTPKDYVRDNTPAQDLLETVRGMDADLLVIGLRRRSAVGKLVLGSNSQDILLQADCPVLAVKAPAGD